MSDPIQGGGLHELKSVGQHFYYDAKKRGEDTAIPLAFMGAVTVGIGCKMLWQAFQMTKAGRKGQGRGR